eukprot:COSAG02_NODE_50701_length_319_cov_0.422727_1_plen_75_part_10
MLRRLGERLDGSRLRGRLVRLYCAGGVLPPEVAEHIGRQLGQRPIDIYGSSDFFKQKTAYGISECDWSSDVCSSD